MSGKTDNKLSLKQIESTGLINWLNDKEIEKAIDDALQEQREILNTPKKKLDTLDYILANGGKTKIEYNDMKYSVSCLTPEQLQHKDNLSNYVEQGYDVELPTIYKFWVRTALGVVFSIQAQTYTIAQEVVDSVFGKRYSVSASKL
mgnify:FL=1